MGSPYLDKSLHRLFGKLVVFYLYIYSDKMTNPTTTATVRY